MMAQHAQGMLKHGHTNGLPAQWASFPGLEFSFRLTETTNTKALSDEYGSNKDKAFDIKYQLLPESKYFPALAIGLHDFHGTKQFPAEYISANRQIYPFDFTLGVGTKRLKGFFGGIEWAITDQIHLMTEYNPIDYTSDKLKGNDNKPVIPEGKDTPFNFGIRYMPVDGLDLGVTYQRGNKVGFLARIELDMGKEMMPKKPDPLFWGKYDPEKKTPGVKTVENTQKWVQDIKAEIEKIGMQDVSVSVKQEILTVHCQNTKYLSNQKAVGRIYRIMLFCSPDDIDKLVVVLTRSNLSILSASVKRDIFKKFVFGEIDPETLNRLIQVEPYPSPETNHTDRPGLFSITPLASEDRKKNEIENQPHENKEDIPEFQTQSNPQTGSQNIEPSQSPGEITVRSDKPLQLDWGIKPDLDLYLNDPSGFFKCGVGATPYASVSPWKGGNVSGRMYIPLYSNIESSNETLPDAVKSDSWKYKGANIRLERLEFNQVLKLTPRSFAMASFGYFESMYAGAAGEFLTYFGNGDLAVGAQYDYAIKRKPKTPFELMDFKRQTVLGNIYYDFRSLDLNLHAQYGKFLAEDMGWRFILTRSYDNGVDIGCWYSFTDTEDLTEYNKGYHDKGIFIDIPVRILSPVEKRSKYSYAISPWTRDVAATVNHSQSLYGITSDLMPGEFVSDLDKIGD